MTYNTNWLIFLWDVFICSLSSYGGPEAHYGVFSSVLVNKKKYITEESLVEMIGLYSLVPGPGSTQTITAIGYHVGGPILAFLTFLVWALPAIIIMSVFGIFVSFSSNSEFIENILRYLPAVAISFIFYAAISLTKKVIKLKFHFFIYLIMFVISYFLVPISLWFVPILLVVSGLITYLKYKEETPIIEKVNIKTPWWILICIVLIAIISEIMNPIINHSALNIFTSFYRYGYSVIGGGQIVIPLMITDLVESQSLITLNDFLSGYAIDQAIPGPLFSFAAFVGSRSFVGSSFAFFYGILSAFSIFLPGILFVYLIYPIWKKFRHIEFFKKFLIGVSITAAALILSTGIRQTIQLDMIWQNILILLIGLLLLHSKRIPGYMVVIVAMILGFII